MKTTVKSLSPMTFILLIIMLSACSGPAYKANKIIKKLPANSGVISKNLSGDKPELITYTYPADTILRITSHQLKSGKTYSILTSINHDKMKIEVSEVFRVGGGYMVITRTKRKDNNYRYLYSACIIRNYDKPESWSCQELSVNEKDKRQAATSYVIDHKAKLITFKFCNKKTKSKQVKTKQSKETQYIGIQL